MWELEHHEDTRIPKGVIWACYSNVDVWPEWDEEVEKVTLDGPFIQGTGGQMKLRGKPSASFTLAEVAEGEGFTTEARMPGAVLRFSHTLTELPDGTTRVTHRAEIDGPAAGELVPVLGPSITGALPGTVRALARVAGRRTAATG